MQNIEKDVPQSNSLDKCNARSQETETNRERFWRPENQYYPWSQ
jgi:hypothetical protein